MPELPEVQTVVDSLRPAILRRRIRFVKLLRADIVRPRGFNLVAALADHCIVDVIRRGKRIIFTLDNGNRFYIHLGMTGRLTTSSTNDPVAKHTHLILHFAGFEVRFHDARRFGEVRWLGDRDGSDDLGPEPLTMRPQQFVRRLNKTRRAIKTALLDQKLLAGLGNIYADESLFAAGIHPLCAANSLTKSQVRRLNRSIKLTLRRALRHRGSTLRDYVDGQNRRGNYQRLLRVYGRSGQPCRVCGTIIQRIVLAGRSTCFCPHCQPAQYL